MDERLWRVAISMTKGATAMLLRRMREKSLSWEEFFYSETPHLMQRLDISHAAVPRNEARRKAIEEAQKSLEFIDAHRIKIVGLGDEGYPRRLAECYDAPTALYICGEADLDAEKMVAMVGTRRCDVVGEACVESMVKGLKEKGLRPTIISGLAYGIDTAAHEAALRHSMPTVAVVAHGLSTIYPSQNKALARQIVKNGGAIVSEYPPFMRAWKQSFLERNRVIAGLSDLTVVVQSDVRGGAMSTARMSREYDRSTGAVPGRYDSELHAGCHHLIRNNLAELMANADDICQSMDWKIDAQGVLGAKGSIFEITNPEQKLIYDKLCRASEPLSVAMLQQELDMNMATVMALLGEMELDGMVMKVPGNRFIAVK